MLAVLTLHLGAKISPLYAPLDARQVRGSRSAILLPRSILHHVDGVFKCQALLASQLDEGSDWPVVQRLTLSRVLVTEEMSGGSFCTFPVERQILRLVMMEQHALSWLNVSPMFPNRSSTYAVHAAEVARIVHLLCAAG